jgi:hypothetical protein
MSKTAWEKQQDEIREIQIENAKERIVHLPDEVHTDVVVSKFDEKSGQDKSEKVGEIHVLGGRAHVKVDAEFSLDDLQVFSQQVEKAYQAVQV